MACEPAGSGPWAEAGAGRDVITWDAACSNAWADGEGKGNGVIWTAIVTIEVLVRIEPADVKTMPGWLTVVLIHSAST